MHLRALLVVAGIATLVAAAPARADVTFTVTGLTDPPAGGSCDGLTCPTIRAALTSAARLVGTDTIVVPVGTTNIGQGELRVTSDVILQGDSARTTIVKGDGKSARLLNVFAGNTAEIRNMTLTAGQADAQDPPYGGGVLNQGTLTLDHVRLTANHAELGGGVANWQGSLIAQYVLVDHNVTASPAGAAGAGGGGILNLGGTVKAGLGLRDSTVAFNSGPSAGGILSRGNAGNTMALQRVTIADNTGGAGAVGGLAIAADGGAAAVRATILFGNTTPGTVPVVSNCGGGALPTDAMFNLEGGKECGFDDASDRQNANPLFPAALTNAGGDLDVLPLGSGSPAIDLAPACTGVTDQRDLARPQGTGCDAGAYEFDLPPPAPVITTPAGNVLQTSSTVNLAGTAEAGSSVEIFDGGSSKGSVTAAGGNWTLTFNSVSDGQHVYTAKATDVTGHTGPASGSRTVTVDTGPPDTVLDSGPSGPVNAEPRFTFSSEPGATFECRLDGPGGAIAAYGACTSPKSYPGLADGSYTFLVRAVDLAQNRDATPVSQDFTLDTAAPPADVVSGPDGPTTDSAPAFGFSSPDAQTTFACKLDGPGAVMGTFGPCTSPASFSGLAPGPYVFSVQATDPAGNTTVRTRPFTVSVPQQATPTPTPTPSPAPVAGKSVVVAPVSGKTLVKKPGSTRFVPVDFTQGIPLGSIVDTRKSKIRLFSIPKPGRPVESALFYDGLFKVTQIGTITQLQLVEALASCKATKASAAAKKPKTRKLWGDGSGSFRTRGQYSAATVRGTRWLVQDSCGKTLTKVAKGVVSVQDFVRHKTLLVRAPKRYTANQR